MSTRAMGRVAVVGLAIGLIAAIGEASGVAPAWAVLAGFAVSVHGAPPVAPRAVTALAAGLAGLAVLSLTAGAGASTAPAAALTAAVLVTGAGLARLRDDSRVPALAVLLGGSTVLAGAHVSGGTGVADVAPALAGLLAGVLPMQVGELVTDLRARHFPAHVPPSPKAGP